MIPKVIHYCWFGKNDKSDLINKCIDSWHEYCRGYEIIEWNEDNFDIQCCDYVKEAYEQKKWAFVSDYARYYILNLQGGIYLDTDVELLKPLDPFLTNNFLAIENKGSIATGLIMGCKKNNKFCKEMLKSFEYDHFILPNGRLNTMTVCERTTNYFSKHGFRSINELQVVDDFTIYPTDYFCPIDPITYECNISDKTVSIHRYAGSWCTLEQKQYLEIRAMYAKKIPYELASTIAYLIVQRKSKGLWKGLGETIKQIITYSLTKIIRR